MADIFAGAVVNGTLYIYGGQAKTSAGQSSNTWSKSLQSRLLTRKQG
jgi:hypothetical protein